jgi:hypothetical protein
MRSFQTIGVDPPAPGSSNRQRAPLGPSHSVGNPVSAETPSPFGPRQVGQWSATADVETTTKRENEINQRLLIVAGHPFENAGTDDLPTVGERDRFVKLSVTSLAEWD